MWQEANTLSESEKEHIKQIMLQRSKSDSAGYISGGVLVLVAAAYTISKNATRAFAVFAVISVLFFLVGSAVRRCGERRQELLDTNQFTWRVDTVQRFHILRKSRKAFVYGSEQDKYFIAQSLFECRNQSSFIGIQYDTGKESGFVKILMQKSNPSAFFIEI